MRAGSSFSKRSSSTTGCSSYPLLTLFHSLLRGIWRKLLDEHLAASLARYLLFQRFCSLESSGDTPDATTLDHFRQQLVQYDFGGEVSGRGEPSTEAAQSGQSKVVGGKPTKDAEAGCM